MQKLLYFVGERANRLVTTFHASLITGQILAKFN
jgi:hypothetical protein